jgi:UDP-N-acetylglucosamine 2-epimerase (non-hydrolysing)
VTSLSIVVPFGTRPEFIKLASVIHALKDHGHRVTVVDTGQHTDTAMREQVQADLGISVDVLQSLPSDPAERRGMMLTNAVRAVNDVKPDVVLSLGDTHTVPTWALAARGARVAFVHLEAGLRGFNPQSIEEANRQVATTLAQLNFAPTSVAADFILKEGVDPARVMVVGNPVIDALVSRGVAPVAVEDRKGILVTAHRPTNVDDPTRLANLVDVLCELAPRGVFFPVHPRTRGHLEASGGLARLEAAGVELTGPVDYDTLLKRLASSELALTDSGGLQEEAAYFGVPALVVRTSTPRWEGVKDGAIVLANLSHPGSILERARRLLDPQEQERVAALPCPYGDGTTGVQVATALADPEVVKLLAIEEPDFTDGSLPW